jgi:hypothetical protein
LSHYVAGDHGKNNLKKIAAVGNMVTQSLCRQIFEICGPGLRFDASLLVMLFNS